MATAGLTVFAVIVVSQGLLPGVNFNPAHQEISEYVHTSAGALMVVGFIAWALSWAVLAGPASAPCPGPAPRWLLTVQRSACAAAAVGLVLVACFATDRGAVQPDIVLRATTEGRLHDGASALVTLSIAVAALAGAFLSGGRTRTLTLLLVSISFGAGLLLLALGDPLSGIRQRHLVAAACTWQVLWLRTSGKRALVWRHERAIWQRRANKAPSMSQEPASLCASLRELAETTWSHMEYQLARDYRAPDERAFTDHHLVELSIRHQPAVQAKVLTQSEEAQTGADFELWLQGDNLFLPLLVQAKKLNRSGRYSGLDRHIGDKTTNDKQLDRLLKACTAAPFADYVPLFLFYNGPRPGDPTMPADRCTNPRLDTRVRGCTIARASEVARVLRRQPGTPHDKLGDIGPICWPWSCLFCCPLIGPGRGLAARAAIFISGPDDEHTPRLLEPHEVPDYVRWMAAGEWGDKLTSEVERRPGARRVVLIRSDSSE